MTLFGNRVFADVVKVSIKMRPSWPRVGPKSKDSVLVIDRKGYTGCREEGDAKTEAEIELSCYKPRQAWDHQRLEEARKDSSPEAPEGAAPC